MFTIKNMQGLISDIFCKRFLDIFIYIFLKSLVSEKMSEIKYDLYSEQVEIGVYVRKHLKNKCLLFFIIYAQSIFVEFPTYGKIVNRDLQMRANEFRMSGQNCDFIKENFNIYLRRRHLKI